MPYTIFDPPADRSLIGISPRVGSEAAGDPTPARWRFKVNAGATSDFNGTGLVGVLGAPPSVATRTPGGKGCDKFTVRIDNPGRASLALIGPRLGVPFAEPKSCKGSYVPKRIILFLRESA